MFRNQYDSDVSIWSPHGRIYQVEYAMEAVNQGSATVGLKSRDYVVLCAFKRAMSSLSAHQEKIEVVDDHILLSMSGLSSDGRILAKAARIESMEHREPIQGKKLMDSLASQCQKPTMVYGQRAFGVGLLVGVVDRSASENTSTHLYQLCPSANYYDCHAMAIGARSQPARTYFDRMLNENPEVFRSINNPNELCLHALRALKDTLPHEEKLSEKNCSLGIVGKNEVARVLAEKSEELKRLLELVNSEVPEVETVAEAVVAEERPEEGNED